MTRHTRIVAAILGLPLWMAAGALHAGCGELTGLAIEKAVVTSAELVPAGSRIALTGDSSTAPVKDEFCRIRVTSKPSADSDIRIELWVPSGAAWNGKFEQIGNGGFAGSIPFEAMSRVLVRGYAVAGTDDGHQAADMTDGLWAMNHPEKIKDYGWRAIRDTTLVSKRLVSELTARPPAKSYFVGCSDGGREALMMAQRFPAFFDGIVAGAPFASAVRTLTGGAVRLIDGNGTVSLTGPQLEALQSHVLRTCGGKGGYLTDPRECHVDLNPLKCPAGGDACLSAPQTDFVRSLYAEHRDPASGAALYGYLPGAEAVKGSWEPWLTNAEGKPTLGAAFAWNYLAFMVRGDPKLKLDQVTTAELARGERAFGPILDSDGADLSAFKAHGGKLLQYHGWNDPAIPPGYSTEFAGRLAAKTPGTDQFYRLYMVPGMLHCGGGVAPTRVDWQAIIENWVEKSSPPGELIAADGQGATQTLRAFQPSAR